jgi:phosphoenolpyruvate synthase/pyruvate phosphate dikinase
LYESYTHRPDEGHIEKSIKQVWASLWTFRAFEEREFYRIDHLTAAMGVLVHPNYQNELANGVGITKNIYDPSWRGYYVNVQLGEDLVTNPEEASIPEEFLVASLAGREEYEIQYVRFSNRVPLGEKLLTKDHILELAEVMEAIQRHFRAAYGIPAGNNTFAMDIEFKITAEGHLNVKQARPWID